VKEILLDAVALDLLGELLSVACERCWLSRCGSLFPCGPGGAAVFVLERHEQCVILEPRRVRLGELAKGCVRRPVGDGAVEEYTLVRDDRVELDCVLWVDAAVALDRDEQGIAGERGERLVRRVAVARRA
jgi:hypothetical protein